MKEFKLDNHPKIATGFNVPENYFENFSAKLLTELPKEEPKVIALFSKSKKMLLAIAAILIVTLSLPLYNHFFNTNSEFDSANIENYLAYQSNITQYDLINEIELNQALPHTEISNDDTAIVEDYLLKDGNIDQLIFD